MQSRQLSRCSSTSLFKELTSRYRSHKQIHAASEERHIKVQRDELERFGKDQLGVKELDDWYSVNSIEVRRKLRFIQTNYGSLRKALKTLYPNHNWEFFRFRRAPKGYWKEAAQRDALEKVGRQFGVKELDDWYKVPSKDIKSELHFISKHYKGSLYEALKNLYPQHDWDRTRFSRVPREFWNVTLQRDALERVGKELGVNKLDDWYSVRVADVQNKLSFIQTLYGSSLRKALKTLYPQHHWDSLRFSRVPSDHWKDESIQREALERVGRQLGVKQLDDWYSVKAIDVHNRLKFIRTHYGSLHNALKTLYPQHNWDRLRFSKVPAGYWCDENAQRDALERYGRERLGVKELDDWYSIPAPELYSELSFIMNYHNGSLFNALQKLYPHHHWDISRFSKVPAGYWKDVNAQREALDRFGEQLGVTELNDWYHVSASVVYRELSFMKKYASFYDALKILYPQHDWDPLRFQRIPQKYWKQSDTVQYYHKLFVKWKDEFHIYTVSDWYELEPHQVLQFKVASKGIFGSTLKMLTKWFPDILWRSQAISQTQLKGLLKHLMADTSTNRYMTVDGFENHANRSELANGHCLDPISYQWKNTWSKLFSPQ